MDLIETITLELRPRLCVVNVYICYKKCVNSSSISVQLINNSVILNMNDKAIHLLEHLKILPMSMSSLIISDSWISLRIQTNPADCKFGSFRTEVLNNFQKETEKSITLSSVPLPTKKCLVTFQCARCQTAISENIEFCRILPLPRNDCDPSEWFCCTHTDAGVKNLSLTPKNTDYLYGSYYFVLNKNVFLSSLKIDNYVQCYNCLSFLGIQKDSESLKMWNSANEKIYKNCTLKVSKPFDDFFLAINESIGLYMGEEILIESSENELFKYVLLKPMEMKVDMLVEKDTNDSAKGNVCMKKIKVMKVMYLYGDNDTSLVQKYPDAKYCQVSSDMVTSGLSHLLLTTNRFPPNYRKVNDWCLGYIILPNMAKFFSSK